MRKLFTSLLLLTVIITPFLALAAPADPPSGLQLPDNPLNDPKDILRTIHRVANWMFSFLIILAVIFILIAAFNYLTGAGSDEKIKKAHKMLLYAAIAVAVGLLAEGLIVVVSKLVSNQGVNFNEIR